jgi:predicted glycoside hydrolase/deacetylase ChbG (UPF0249 family)
MPSQAVPAKRLIVNADDLGYDPEIDRGIFEAHRVGIVTSATLMVDTPFSRLALAAAPDTLAIGLHVVFPPDLAPELAEGELLAQIERFHALRGAVPTHLDSHRHVHAQPGMLAAFVRTAGRMGIPMRAVDGAMRLFLQENGVPTVDHFLGDARLFPYWTVDRLRPALHSLEKGATELMCHPGHTPSHARTSFGKEREDELLALCDPGVRAILVEEGIALITYEQLDLQDGGKGRSALRPHP